MNCRNSSTPSRKGWLKSALLGAALVLFGTASAQTIWNAGSLAFSNTGGAGTDNITVQTVLTRGAVGPIYNSACQAAPGATTCALFPGPCNTEWALGTIANWNTLTYAPLYTASGCNPPSMVGQTWVCHLMAENIYFEATWSAYNGGTYAYTRTTGPGTVTTNGGSGLAINYLDLASAITALNAATITSPVVITVNAASPQTAPAGGYAITATGTVVNTIVIAGGANTISAPTPQTAGNLNDAIFKIIGGDYVTIQNCVMNENGANTTTVAASNNMTEWGVALLYASTTNGAQNCTIQNNTITLNRTYQNTFGVYSNSTHSATAPTTSATATTTAGGNSNLTVRANNISNVNNGIVVVGPTAAADHNDNVVIGGPAPGDANTISDYGTTGTFSGYANVSGTVYGILMRNTRNYNISYNSITSSIGGTIAGTLRGIYVPSFSNAPTGTLTQTINNNNISVRSGVSAVMQGITVESSTSTATSAHSINTNNFNNVTHTVASSSAITFISQGMAVLTTSMNGNTFTNITCNTTGSVTLLTSNISRPANAVCSMSNNAIVGSFSKTGAGGSFTGYISNSTTPVTGTETTSGNNFSNITLTGATGFLGIQSTDGSTSTPFGPTKTASNNTFSNITNTTSTSSTFLALDVSYSNVNTANNLSGNTVSGITWAGSGTVQGIISRTASQNLIGNTVTGITNVGTGTINPISIAGSGSTPTSVQNVRGNRVCNIEGNGATATVNGIVVSSGTNVDVSNNIVGDLRAPSTSAANSLNGINLTISSGTVTVYYNTVNLSAAAGGANFGSSAISVNTGATVTMRNNILVNNSVANGTGFAVAYRRSGTTLTSYAAASNNNIFYAGVPSASRLIFFDGTNSDQLFTAYQTRVSTRDNASQTENPTFASTSCGTSDFLHFAPATVTFAESGGANISGVTTDYDAQTRQGNPGYAGTGSAPDIGADEFDGVNPNSCSGAPTAGAINGTSPICAGTGTTLTLVGASAQPGITYQWRSSTTMGGPYNTLLGTSSTQATGNLAQTTYYVVDVTCTSPGGSTVQTAEFTVVVNPTPTAGASSNSPVCAGQPLNLTGTTDIGATFNWSGPNSFVSTSQSPQVSASATTAMAGTYTFTATFNGCTSLPATTSVSVFPSPSITSVTATPGTICPGGSSQLQVVATMPAYVIGAGGTTYQDISGTGTAVTPAVSDDSEHNITIPSFVFNGVTYTTARVGMNGSMVFGSTTGEITHLNVPFPSAAHTAGNIFLSPWWDDLDIQGGANIFTQTVGNLFIVQWNNCSHDVIATGANNIFFQIQLNTVTGVIYFAYQDVLYGNAGFDAGISASVGIQWANNASGFAQYSASTASLSNGQVISFTPTVLTYLWSPAGNLNDATIANPISTLASPGTENYTVTVSSAGCSSIGNTSVTAVTVDDGDPCTLDACLNGVVTNTFQDADSDGTCDANDGCPNDPNKIAPGICGCGIADTDTDGDLTADCNDGCPLDANKIAPGICGCGIADTDTDGDLTADCNDGCPLDANKIAPGQCGCGIADTDTDGDLTADCNDGCPLDMNKTTPGLCGCGVAEGTCNDCEGVPAGPAQPGTSCNDLDPCTINDTWSPLCVCVGTFEDTDSDGTCDANDGCPLDPNKIAPGICGCGVSDVDTDIDGIADCNDNCPTVPGVQGDACDDNNPGTENDVLDANCLCNGTPIVCLTNEVTLVLNTDASASQTTWDIVNGGTSTVVCGGGGYANNSTITVSCCLADGCYDLRVFDSFGDGINPGGYLLKDASNRTIINNVNNGAGFTTLSMVRDMSNVAQSFCVPLSNQTLASGCDNEAASTTTVIQASFNSGVTAGYSPTASTTGYQFWFFNPNGGYSRKIFQSHASPGSYYPPGTPNGLKCAYLRLNAIVSNPLPTFTLLNVRVRTQLSGVFGPYGPACRLMIDPLAACQITQLTTTGLPVNPAASCGASVNRNGGNIYANTVTGANKYQFQFTRPGYTRNVASSTRTLTLAVWFTNPLVCGLTYDVKVRASFDNGATYCPYGPTCPVTITCPASLMGDLHTMEAADEVPIAPLQVWPNPNDGEQLFLSLEGIDPTVETALVDITDLFGRRVFTQTIPVDGSLNQPIELKNMLADGVYVLTVTTGERVSTERIVIQ